MQSRMNNGSQRATLDSCDLVRFCPAIGGVLIAIMTRGNEVMQGKGEGGNGAFVLYKAHLHEV